MKHRQKLRKGLILFSFFLFPAIFHYLSPVLIIEASYKGILNRSFIMLILMFISALFLGRGYCGWVISNCFFGLAKISGRFSEIAPNSSHEVINNG